jgi:enterochelin esterase-like enzyme
MQDVPHGKISYRYYHSVYVGFDRPLCVYTPAGYDPKGKEKYPILYLIHGMTDTYETWFKVGRINMILDNLIAQGLAEKMIIVMPYANPYPEMMRRGPAKSMDYMGTDLFTNEILNEVIPYMETNYRVRTDADGRAIAGFSLGGRQSLACGLGNPGKFHYVCALHRQFSETRCQQTLITGFMQSPKSSGQVLNLCGSVADFRFSLSDFAGT